MLRLYCIFVSPLIFIWLLPISQYPTLWARRRGQPPNYSLEFEDDKFVEKYGNDNTTSGLWEPVRNILDDNAKVINICTQAHQLFFKGTPNLTATGFYVKQLNFPNSPQYQPMDLDMLVYTCELRYQGPNTPYLFHFTKGLEPHCIYYLVPLDPSLLTVQLQEHVCGLKFPFDT